MKKLFVVIIFAGAILFGITHLELFANPIVDEELVLALLDEKTVVVSGGKIYNLTYMQEFLQNVHTDIDNEIHLIIDPYTTRMREYRLQYLDGRILLFSSIENNGIYNHKVGEYERLFRMYKGQEIHYVLECPDGNEYVLFGHRTD